MGTSFSVFQTSKESKKKKQEVCCVVYDTNLFGLKGPRKMTLIFPSTDMEKVSFALRIGKERIT